MPATLPKVILFDLDDTLVDFGSSAASCWQAVCDAAALEVEGLDSSALFAAISRVRDWYWSDVERHREGRADLQAASRRIVERALGSLGTEAPRLAHAMADAYREFRNSTIRLFPGAVDTLRELRTRGVRLGLVTNGTSADQRAKIERFQLGSYFDHILIEGEFGCGKPNERVYHAALQATAAPAEHAWFVGDNLEWDVAAPQRLGMYTVWIDAAGGGLPPGAEVKPHRIIGAVRELL